MISLGSCPRCQGALQLSSDQYGEYFTCMQCGFSVDIPRELPESFKVKPGREKPGRKKKAAA